MEPNYAHVDGGGGISSSGGGGGIVVGGNGNAVAPVGVGSNVMCNSAYYKDLGSCQRNISYSSYDPYGGSGLSARITSAYPYDAEAEFKERTGMGKIKSVHPQMAGNTTVNKLKQQHSYNVNSCYGGYNQNNATLAPENVNHYAYAYDQHHHYSQQQQQYHQSRPQQQYKYNTNAKLVAQQHPQQGQQQSLPLNAMKMSPPDYGYTYHHLQHPYYHPHYHHTPQQKGGVGVMKTIPDGSAVPYVNNKMAHSTGVTARAPQYPSNYSYHPQSYSSAVPAGHHTYQSQSVCDDNRWMWNSSSGNEYHTSCRSAYPAYVNGSTTKQNTIWPSSVPIQYQNTGYPAASTNQSCCLPSQNATSYYPQQYAKYPMQAACSVIDYTGSSSNDPFGNSQVNPVGNVSAKVYNDLNTQPLANTYQAMNSASIAYHQPSDYNSSPTIDYNARYLQQQQSESHSSSSTSSAASYNHHYYYNHHPYSHQPFSTAEPQENMYDKQQVDSKINLTTKSQSLRDFLTSWNEDEDEDRAMNSTEIPYIEHMHIPPEHFSQSQEQQHSGPIVENHLQFKGSFSSSSRPKIHVGITVDSTVEPDQYINLPDIIIDIEKSNKDITNISEEILVATSIPKTEKDAFPVKEEKQDSEPLEIAENIISAPQVINEFPREKKTPKNQLIRHKRLRQLRKFRLIKRNQRKSKVPRKLFRPKIRRVKNKTGIINSLSQFNPQSLKCLCVSLINSDKFRNRILEPSEIDNLLNFTTDNEVNSDASTNGNINLASSSLSSVIPKLSDLCKNALNSSFDRDVLVINLDEILDSDNLFVVQCDINENILESYTEQQHEHPQQQQQQLENNNNQMVEILNDNNNNYNNNYNLTSTSVSQATTNSTSKNIETVITAEDLKRCCSATEVSNLPLDNSVKHNNNFNLTTTTTTNNNSLVHQSPESPPSPASASSCPATLCCRSSSPLLIEQNCSTQQISVGHEQLNEILTLSGFVHNDNDDDGINSIDQLENDDHHNNSITDNSELIFLASTVSTPSIHHEEIVPDNLKKFQNEKFFKYLHTKYVQGNLSEFYHANRIIKKYKKRFVKKILNIVR